MRNLFYVLFIASIIVSVALSCKTSQVIANKQGVQLWAENCVRCHYAPSPADFNDQQWEIIGTHMEVRACITDEERDKIIEFLKSAN